MNLGSKHHHHGFTTSNPKWHENSSNMLLTLCKLVVKHKLPIFPLYIQ